MFILYLRKKIKEKKRDVNLSLELRIEQVNWVQSYLNEVFVWLLEFNFNF